MSVVTPPMYDVPTLRQIVKKSDQALAGLDQQITDIQTRILQRTEQLNELGARLAEDERQTQEADHAMNEAEQRHSQAVVSASVATGTAAEASTAAHVQEVSQEIDRLHRDYEAMLEQHKQRHKAAVKHRTTSFKEIEESKTEVLMLQESRERLAVTRHDASVQLGQALYDAYATELREKLAQVAKLEDDLAGEQLALANLIDDAQVRLRDYPDLLQQARQEVIPAPKPELAPTIKLTRGLVRYLQLLAEHGRSIESTSHTNTTRARMMFQVPGSLLEQLNLGNAKLIHAWIAEVQEFERQLLQQERDRASMRKQRGY